MREAEELAGVTEAQVVVVHELASGRGGRGLRTLSFLLGSLPRRLAPAQRLSHLRGEPDMLNQFRPLSIVDPEAQRLSDSAASLVECPAVAVTTPNRRHARQPCPTFVPLEVDVVLRGLYLSHFPVIQSV